MDTRWYGEDGMSDSPSTLPLDEWRLDVCSWYKTRYGNKAGSLSEVKLMKVFTSRDDANEMWKLLKHIDFTVDELLERGFKRFA